MKILRNVFLAAAIPSVAIAQSPEFTAKESGSPAIRKAPGSEAKSCCYYDPIIKDWVCPCLGNKPIRLGGSAGGGGNGGGNNLPVQDPLLKKELNSIQKSLNTLRTMQQ